MIQLAADLQQLKDQMALTDTSLPEPYVIFFGIFFSVVGIAFIGFGRKQSPIFFVAGIGLLIFSFFGLDFLTYVLIGAGLIIGPFIIYWFTG